MESIGDLARSLVLRTNQVRLREDMDRLAVEVATGFVKDKAKHLGGDVTGLTDIDRTLVRLEAFRINNAEATFLTGTMQSALDEMQTRSESVSQSLISAELTPTASMTATLSNDARDALVQNLSNLNRSAAGRSLFAGAATDRAAVVDADTLMSEVLSVTTGLTTVEDIDAALDAFFAVGGAYDTAVYQGSSTGLSPLRLSENETASVDIKATDQAFRDLLKPLVKAALVNETSLSLDVPSKVTLLADAGRGLMAAQQQMVELRAGLGALEQRIEESVARNEAERTATQLARLDLVGADQYETAARYESIRGQLESLYAITARSQRLSLAAYL